jgi:hypothetical protein
MAAFTLSVPVPHTLVWERRTRGSKYCEFGNGGSRKLVAQLEEDVREL